MEIITAAGNSESKPVNAVEVGQTFRYVCDAGSGPVYLMTQDEDGNNRIVDLSDGEAYELGSLDEGENSKVVEVNAKIALSA